MSRTLPKLVYSAEEVCQILLIDPGEKSALAALEYYRRRGLLKGAKFGRHIRFPVEHVHKFVEQKFQEEPR